MERFGMWFTHMLLALAVLMSVLDYIPPAEMGQKEKYAISCASISMGLSLIVVLSHFLDSMKRCVVGTVIEMLCSTIPLSLWVVGTIIIQNPENWFASDVNPETGFEEIQYANLYFSSWAILFHNIYLLAYIFHDSRVDANKGCDSDLAWWLLLFSVSGTLCGMCATLRSGVCQLDGVMACRRTDLGIAIGATCAYLAFMSLILIGCGIMKIVIRILVGFVACGLYITGIFFMTSSPGPGVDMGSIYFCIWGGSACSVVLFTRALGELFDSAIVDSDGRAKPAFGTSAPATATSGGDIQGETNPDDDI